MNYGKLLKQARDRKGVKAKYVASQLGISIGRYSELEAGRCRLTVERAQQIADILGITLADLLCQRVSEPFNDDNDGGMALASRSR